MGDAPEDSREELFGPTDLCEKIGSTFIKLQGSISLRDIKAGEEITQNYDLFEPDQNAFEEMGFGTWVNEPYAE